MVAKNIVEGNSKILSKVAQNIIKEIKIKAPTFPTSLNLYFASVLFHFFSMEYFNKVLRCSLSLGINGERSLLQISQHRKPKRTLKNFANHHYIKNGFLVDHYIKIDKDHYYKNQNVEKSIKSLSFV